MGTKTIAHIPELQELIDEIQKLKDKDDELSMKKMQKLTQQLYDAYNPVDNEIQAGDSKIKWQIDPNVGNFGKTKFEVEFNKDLKEDEVEFFIKVNGKMDSFISPPKESGLKANIGLKIKYQPGQPNWQRRLVQDQNVGGSNPLSGIFSLAMYKYEIALYLLYKEFDNQVFCTYEAEEIFRKYRQFEFYLNVLSVCSKRKLLREVPPEEAKKRRSYCHHSMRFRELSPYGKERAQYFDANQHILTKYLLRKHNNASNR